MLQNEFEDRIGRSVENDEYVFANALYVSCPDSIDKDEFCEMYKGAKINTYAYRLLNYLLETITAKERRIEDLCRDADGKRQAHDETKKEFAEFCIYQSIFQDACQLENMARELVGDREYLKMKLAKGQELSENDKSLLMELL